MLQIPSFVASGDIQPVKLCLSYKLTALQVKSKQLVSHQNVEADCVAS